MTMGFFNALKNILGGEKCPACGTPGARKVGNEVRCLNPTCQYFNPSFSDAPAQPPQSQPSQPAAPQGKPAGWSSTPAQPPQGKPSGWSSGSGQAATPPAGSVAIQYRNFQGQDKTFHADARSLHREKNHIVATVAPQGRQINLSRERIQNLQEVESKMQQRVAPGQNWPTPRERQVLNYHKKNGTTSPLYEKIRAKYPSW
jgi:hypothetical protein